MRLRDIEKLVKQLVSGGGGGVAFDWTNEPINLDLSLLPGYDAEALNFPAGIGGDGFLDVSAHPDWPGPCQVVIGMQLDADEELIVYLSPPAPVDQTFQVVDDVGPSPSPNPLLGATYRQVLVLENSRLRLSGTNGARLLSVVCLPLA